MSIAHDVRAFLLDEPNITDITDHVYRNDVPEQADRPYVNYRRTRGNDDLTRDGYGLLTESVFSVDCIADTQEEADQLADAVKNRFQSINALVHNSTPTLGQATVRGVFVRDKSDDYFPFPDASDLVIPFSSMDVEIWHV